MPSNVLQSLRTRLSLTCGRSTNTAPTPSIVFDPSGTILHAHPELEALFGYAAGELTGRHHRDLLPADQQPAASDSGFPAAVQRGQRSSGIMPRRHRDGQILWLQTSYQAQLDSQGRLIRIVKQAIDITAQYIANQDMQARLGALDRSQGMIEFDMEGTIIHANDRFLDLIGYRLDEIVGQHHSLLLDPADTHADSYQRFWQHLRQGRMAAALFRRIARGGREIWIQASYNPIIGADGAPLKVIKYATDVTAQTLATHALQHEVVQLSDTVRDNARIASQATVVSQQASERVDEGRQLTDKLVADMAAIRTGMQAIGGITSLIEDITFRTRLLSLNASVEAAHAGDAGRGFAIVAAEMNDLAAQCKSAAEDIRQRLLQAEASVHDGEQHVAVTHHAMQGIGETVLGIRQSTDAIHQAARRQEGGIQRVHAAVAELEQATHAL